MNIEKLTIGGILLLGVGILSACSLNTQSDIPIQHTTNRTISSDASYGQACPRGAVDDANCPQGAVAISLAASNRIVCLQPKKKMKLVYVKVPLVPATESTKA